MPDPFQSKTRRASGGRRPRGRTRWLLCGALVPIGLVLGCRPRAAGSDGTQAAVRFDPSHPTVGPDGLEIDLSDAAGRPLRLGHLQVEGDMNHAGMRPVFADLKEEAPGHYVGRIDFTMGGDWSLVLSGPLPGGGSFNKVIDVPGVKAP